MSSLLYSALVGKCYEVIRLNNYVREVCRIHQCEYLFLGSVGSEKTGGYRLNVSNCMLWLSSGESSPVLWKEPTCVIAGDIVNV